MLRYIVSCNAISDYTCTHYDHLPACVPTLGIRVGTVTADNVVGTGCHKITL